MTDYDQPSLVVFAGPNGSGKSTVTSLVSFAGVYVNADDIQRVNQCDPLAAAQMAEAMRNNLLSSRADFTFETVLSTERNQSSEKGEGYRIFCKSILCPHQKCKHKCCQGCTACG